MRRAARLRIVTGLLLCALTLAFFQWEGRFRVAEANVLADAEMSDGFRHWAGTPGFVGSDREQGGAVALLAGGKPRMTYLGQPIDRPGRFERYRVSLDLRLQGVVPRAIPWQRAGIVLRPFDAAGVRFRHWPYLVAEEAGTAAWHRVENIIPVPDGAASLWLMIYNAGSAGTMWVRDLRVEGLAETTLGAGLRYGLMAAWAGLILSAALAVLQRGRPVLRWGLLGLGAFILAGTLAPEPGLSRLVVDAGKEALRLVDAGTALVTPSRPPAPPAPAGSPRAETEAPRDADPAQPDTPPAEEEADSAPEAAEATDAPPATAPAAPRPFLDWINAIVYDGRPILGLGLASFAHLSAYFAFAGLSVLTLRGIALGWLAGSLLLAAAATEVLQSFTVTRGVEAGDLMFNTAGIAAGLGLGLLARRLRSGLSRSG